MTIKTDNWQTYEFGDLARNLTVAVKDPLSEGYERYVGLEHIEPGNMHIKSWGNVADGTTFTRVFKKGQVLFGKRRAYQRKAALAEFDGICSGDILVFEANEDNVIPELLPFIVQGDKFFDYAIKTSAGSLSPRTKFKDLANLLKAGESEQENCKRFKQHLLSLGVDDTPYMVAGSGRDGYGSIIMGPGDKIIEEGDLFIVDTGSVFDSYFCDFDRNYAFGFICDEAKRAYQVVFDATDAGFNAAQVGNTTSDVYHAMNDVMQKGGALGNSVGRLGHGLGLQLTEWPSNTATDNTILEPGVILTLEPGMEFLPGKEMVHEENIVITENGPEWLTKRAPEELPIIQ